MTHSPPNQPDPGVLAVVCPTCRGALHITDTHVRCEGCAWRRACDRGYLPLCDGSTAPVRGFGPRLMHWRPLARVYERVWRPTFVSIASRQRPDLDAEQAWVEAHLAPAVGGHVVDLSCGPGLMARRFAASGRYASVCGVDLSEAMLDELVASCRAEGTSVRAILADVSHLPFSDGAIAGAHAGAALHLWPDPLAALIEVGRVLRPGGVFVASTFVHPERYGIRHAAENVFERLTETRFYDHEELQSLCAAAGLVGYEERRQSAWVVFSVRAVG
ncbi:MAG: class I SAM-dependent methyltransferase [Myxococcota bacterium]|nr:class I SAM-dependent methyltransferase [Myxococcota bacterium]